MNEQTITSNTDHWNYNDGGRKQAGYKGVTGDCGVRAISIVTGMDYQEVYDLVGEYAKRERITKNKKSKSHPRTGIWGETLKRMMLDLGWSWKATMTIGSGCKTHLTKDELPKGKILCRLSKHYVAVVDGVVNDTYDCTREGTRCVYGYYYKE